MSHPFDYKLLAQQIEIWKSRYGSIFKVDIGNLSIIYRSLTLTEYFYLASEKESNNAQDWAIESAVLHSSGDIAELSEPELTTLYNTIFEASCFGDQDTLNDRVVELRELYYDNLWKGVCIFILRALPSYKMEELEDMTVDKLLDLYIVAEMIHGNQFLAPTNKKDARKAGLIEDRPQPNTPSIDPQEIAPGVDELSQQCAISSHEQLIAKMKEHREQFNRGNKVKPTNPEEENRAMDNFIASLNRK